MRKIKSSSVKIAFSIAIFSLIVTAIFVAFFIVASKTDIVLTQNNSAEGVYTINSDEMLKLISSGDLVIDAKNISLISDYNEQYNYYLFKMVLPFAIAFCTFLIIMSVLLWITIRRIQKEHNLKIVNQLNCIEENKEFVFDDPSLMYAYNLIRQKFDDNLNDYKRLNSYLSHEQKNEIAILRTSLELSNETEYLENIDQISSSIDDVLTLSESKEIETKATVDVVLVCALVCDAYRKIQNNISLEFDDSDDTEIIAKERWIYRAVANLVSNAVKYGNEKPIIVTVRTKNQSVIVSVKDNGIGIALSEQEKIFNNRYRINDLNKDGYGIGLSLVSHVADLCGGFAMMESEENVGSTFYLSFPKKQ